MKSYSQSKNKVVKGKRTNRNKSKMVDFNPIRCAIILHVNGLRTPIKRHRLLD